MRTATVRELRNHYTGLLNWIDAGEEIVITQRGKPVARLIPEPSTRNLETDWSKSPTLTRRRSSRKRLSAKEALKLIHESAGRW